MSGVEVWLEGYVDFAGLAATFEEQVETLDF